MRKILWPVVLSLIANGLPAKASLVRDAALNHACEGNVDVVVYEGMGAALDFTETGYVVQRAWLGDPSKLTLDTDGPMEQGATSVIYLRVINALSFEGLPSTDTTVLTTRLSGPGGPKLCQFPISYSSGNPEYTSLRLNNGSSLPQNSDTQIPTTQLNIDDVEAGINLNALTIGEENPVVLSIHSFISKVRSGQSQQSVAQELGIAWSLLVELERQGANTQQNGAYEAVSI